MTQTALDLNAIERRTYRARYEDGLAEMMIGVWLIVFGALMRTDYSFIGSILPVLLVPVWQSLHNRISLPRAGYVEESDERREKSVASQVRLGLALLVVLVAGVFVFVYATRHLAPGGGKPLGLGAVPLGIAIALLLGGAGWMYDLKRMVVHAVVLTAVFIAGHHLGLYPPVYVALSGVPLLVFGTWVLVRFLQRNPVVDVELQDQGR